MKLLGITFLFFLLSAAFAIMIDLMDGLKLSMSLRNMTSPFSVMTAPEYIILFVLLSMMFVSPIVSFFKQKK